MNTIQINCAKFAACLLALLPAPAFATEHNYQNYLLGDRSAGMGGAAAALGGGVDACYYNPAGLVRGRQSSLSVSAGLYGYHDFESENALYPDEEFKAHSFLSIPSTMGSLFSAGSNAAVALSAFIPTRFAMGEINFFRNNRHYYSFTSDSQSLWLGPSAAVRLTPELSLGASVFGVYRTLNEFVSLYWEREGVSYSHSLKTDNFSMLAVAGAQYRLSRLWSAGAVFQSPCIEVSGSGSAAIHAQVAADASQNSGAYAEELKTRYQVPPRITLGIGCEEPGKYAFGLDVTYRLPTSYVAASGNDIEDALISTYEEKHDPAVDFNVGAEYFLKQYYPLRAGFFTSFSSAPEPGGGDAEAYASKVDLYGISISIGRRLPNVDASIGINYVFGTGEAYGWKIADGAPVQSVTDAEERHLYVFLNTSYAF